MSAKLDMLDMLVSEQGGACDYCGRAICSVYDMIEAECGHLVAPTGVRVAELDHKMPKSRGGSDDPSNLCASCGSCNAQKRDKTPEEYQAWKRQKSEASHV